ncbi:PH domain-containing protein [Microbacterium aerolatum]|uniref:PH domain-containing protein n=1 Tax=Microbacterium aerolatum TaxID=153731 RepID=UPI0038501625
MTQPTTLGGRPMMPPPGAPAEELLIARFHGHARGLFWSALLMIAIFGATAYFYDNLPGGYENWMLIAAAAVLLVLGVVVPYLIWASRTYTVTTRRVIVHRGLGARQRREMSHVRGYTIGMRRGILQRMWGAGTITLSNGMDSPLQLVNIPNVALVNEALADQIEVNQILAHRDAQTMGDTDPVG